MSTSVPSGNLATIDVGRKLGRWGCAFFSAGSWVPISHKVAWAEAYLHTKWHLSPSSRLATTDMGRKLGAVPLYGRESGIGGHHRKAINGRVNSTEVLSTSYKNLINFGPLTHEFTVMVCRPFMRQMREIVETRSILGSWDSHSRMDCRTS